MNADHHACPVEGCKHTDVSTDRVMCWKHWAMVPRDLQNSVYRWAKVSAERKRIQTEHLQAVRSAIESVNNKCRRARLREDQGVEGMQFPEYFNGNTNGIN